MILYEISILGFCSGAVAGPVVITPACGFVNAIIGLRTAPEVERQGLDINEHGEEGYVES